MKLTEQAFKDWKKKLRQAVADYIQSEGCSCCRDMDGHAEATKRLGRLLNIPPYKDGSGYNFSKYRTKTP